ncbi:hypothetical protein DL93DRAFT_2170466 [Clavulina sp. PMI_390]|nr:hypothetical protein DL93DRAFT_2170466 [Clavulina sp. PMI_390]
MVSVNTLPPELIVHIFQSVVDQIRVFDTRRYKQLFRILQVCTLWNSLALSTATFWSGISCCVLRSPGYRGTRSGLITRSRLRIESLIERSKASPIDVFLECSFGDERGKPMVTIFNDIILPHATRIRRLDVSMPSVDHIMDIFPLKEKFPKMVCFSFDTVVDMVCIPKGGLPAISFFHERCDVHLDFLEIKTPLSISIQGVHIPSLSRFHGGSLCIPPSFVLQLLTQAPHLRSLSIPDLEVSQLECSPFPLLRLQYLSTSYHSVGDLLYAPNLIMLDVRRSDFDVRDGVSWKLGPTLRSLQYLVIRESRKYSELCIPDLLRCLEEAPSLKLLIMKSITRMDAVEMLSFMNSALHSTKIELLPSLCLLEFSTKTRDRSTLESFLNSLMPIMHSICSSRPKLQALCDEWHVYGADVTDARAAYAQIQHEAEQFRRVYQNA